MLNHPTETEINQAISTLKAVIEAAENSNHNGEVALMKAVKAIKTGPWAFPPRAEELAKVIESSVIANWQHDMGDGNGGFNAETVAREVLAAFTA